MDRPRFIFSALCGVFCAAVIFATVTTVRHASHRTGSVVARPEIKMIKAHKEIATQAQPKVETITN
jgi:hypothetical protein